MSTERSPRRLSDGRWPASGRRFSAVRVGVAVATLTLLVPGLGASTGPGEAGGAELAPLAGEQAERFLRKARVVHRERVPVGVTRPFRLTLNDGERTARAIFKTVDIYRHFYRLADGRPELGFRDSYRHEVAAYELDKLLDLGMVPPTVERKVDREWGSLQLWIENAMTETERRERDVPVPDPRHWNDQIHTVRLVRQLVDDADFKNISNLLLDESFKVWAIDYSRAFRLGKELRKPEELERFSRTVLDRLRTLDAKVARRRLGPWLTPVQIRTLLLRRDLILEHADRLIAERGEAAVLFP